MNLSYLLPSLLFLLQTYKGQPGDAQECPRVGREAYIARRGAHCSWRCFAHPTDPNFCPPKFNFPCARDYKWRHEEGFRVGLRWPPTKIRWVQFPSLYLASRTDMNGIASYMQRLYIETYDQPETSIKRLATIYKIIDRSSPIFGTFLNSFLNLDVYVRVNEDSPKD